MKRVLNTVALTLITLAALGAVGGGALFASYYILLAAGLAFHFAADAYAS